MIVRRELSGDIDAIRRVTAAAVTRPDAPDPVEASLVDRLRADACWLPALSLVAVDGDEVIGYGIEPAVAEWAPYFQVRTLAGYDPAARGTFAYAEPFNDL